MIKPIAKQANQSDLNSLFKRLQKSKVLKTGRSLDLGEVFPFMPFSVSELDGLCPSVLRLIRQCGYVPAGDEAIPPDVVVTKGNIAIHSDAGSGLTALTLLHVDPLTRSPSLSLVKSSYEHTSYLWTAETLVPLEIGETIMLDTDQDHAWFCSGIATFLCIPVRESKAITMDANGLLRPSA
jgi:hypothetical protein